MIHLPGVAKDPLRAIGVRVIAAVGLVVFVAFVVYLDRDDYRDVNEDGLTLLDSFYYAVVSLSTTGYGDITPMSQAARLLNVLLITPARIMFLIILVGTTLQVLTEQYRTNARLTRWRRTVKDHVIVCGYGTKGRSAVKALLETGLDHNQVVVVESNPAAARQAAADGLVCIEGSATSSAVLTDAHVKRAKTVIIATNTDESAVLVTLTTRQLTGGQVRIVAATREDENVPLLKQSGAHHVIVSSATAGRLMGLSTSAPPLIDVVEDLLTPGAGMALAMRSATRSEVGTSPRDLGSVVIALVRRGQIVSLAQPEAGTIQTGDMLVYIRDEATAEVERKSTGVG